MGSRLTDLHDTTKTVEDLPPLLGPTGWKKTCLSNCTPSWKSGGRLHHKLPEGILEYPLIIIKTFPAKILRKIYLYMCLFFFF